VLLTSVIIVLREVLEAALLVAVLLAATQFSIVGRGWVRISVAAGVLGSALFYSQFAAIFEWFDGVGYEVTNAALQLVVYMAILLLIWLLQVVQFRPPRGRRFLQVVMGLAVCLAIIREGSELLLYFSGLQHNADALPSGVIGSIVGAGVGFSVGVLLYVLFCSAHRLAALYMTIGVLILVGGGMCSQATMLLIQADWLPSQLPLWDSSQWLSERSISGQLLYALIGYEATPTPLQVVIYLASLFIAGVVAISGWLYFWDGAVEVEQKTV